MIFSLSTVLSDSYSFLYSHNPALSAPYAILSFFSEVHYNLFLLFPLSVILLVFTPKTLSFLLPSYLSCFSFASFAFYLQFFLVSLVFHLLFFLFYLLLSLYSCTCFASKFYNLLPMFLVNFCQNECCARNPVSSNNQHHFSYPWFCFGLQVDFTSAPLDCICFVDW